MYLMFDIGGTYTRIAYSRSGRKIEKKVVHPTPNKFSAGMTMVKKTISDFNLSHKPLKAVGGIAGPLDPDKRKLVNAPHLRGWTGKPLARELEKIFRCGVHLENDTALVGLGESHYGAGRGHSIVAYITISTGVGGVRIVDGRIDKSAMGFEMGHQIVNPHASKQQTLEKLISGTAILKHYKKHPSEIDDVQTWKRIADWTVIGIANTIVYWSPNTVVLGGGVSNELKHYFPYIKKKLKKELTIFPKLPILKKASLKTSGGLYGALALIKQRAV